MIGTQLFIRLEKIILICQKLIPEILNRLKKIAL